MPDTYAGLKRIQDTIETPEEGYILEKEFTTFASQSIDYGIMEKAKDIYILPGTLSLIHILLDDYGFEYRESLFSMKPILMSSEIDDSRPTVIRKYSKSPTFIGVLSGKINTVYDLDEVLQDE